MASWYICLLFVVLHFSFSSFSSRFRKTFILCTSHPVSRFKGNESAVDQSITSNLSNIPKTPTPKMKATTSITAFTLAALASAAPADVVRRQAPTTASASSYAAPLGTGSAALYPSSFGTAPLYPTGTAPAYPIGTGQSCPSDGALVCSPDGTQFGLCNFGKVSFQPVAAGTKCVDGEIQFADGYAGAAAPSGVFPPSGAAYPAATGA